MFCDAFASACSQLYGINELEEDIPMKLGMQGSDWQISKYGIQ
jgi:hypothetical protein